MVPSTVILRRLPSRLRENVGEKHPGSRTLWLRLCTLGLVVASSGCGEILLGMADFFGGVSDGLRLAGNVLSPAEYLDLNGVFDKAVLTPWTDGTATLSSGPQPEVAAFYDAQLTSNALPAYYLNERWFRLDAPPPGQAVRIEFLSDVANSAYLYDVDHVQFGCLQTYDLDGTLRTVNVPAVATSAIYVRLNLNHLMSTDEPLARLSWIAADSVALPQPQTVVLDMSGHTGLTFRGGSLMPTTVAAIYDPATRAAVVRTFRGIYAPYNLTVLTDADPAPVGPHSVIFIGPANPPLGGDKNGLSEWIDGFNQAADDIAVVDLTSTAFGLAGVLGPDALGTAAGLVAAHEMGHLLGLSHTLDPDDLMTTGARGIGLELGRLLERQFRRAPLDSGIVEREFALGEQDPQAYLTLVLGPAPASP